MYLIPIRKMIEENKIIACICSGAQLLISAKIVKGRKIAGYYSMEDDLINANDVDWSSLPTSDPRDSGKAWNDRGTVKIS